MLTDEQMHAVIEKCENEPLIVVIKVLAAVQEILKDSVDK